MKRLLLSLVSLVLLFACPALFANPIYQLQYVSDVSSNGNFYAGATYGTISSSVVIGPYNWAMQASTDGGGTWAPFNPTTGSGTTFSTYCLSFNTVPGTGVWYDVSEITNPATRYLQAAQIIAKEGQSITWTSGTTTLTQQFVQIALWTMDIQANFSGSYDLTNATIDGNPIAQADKDFILWLAGGGLGSYNGTVTVYAYTQSQGQSILISVPGTQTPEPASIVLLGAGLLGLGLIGGTRRRKR